ncbi:MULTISPECIES: DUF1433 domain-containing protein [Bacillus]|uniref:DUF1433 domain-containing protein n=2 Tax=Bacillus cereus group TaxID=86661 RepID=A0A2A8J6V0_BACCE|nr:MULTISPECIES: DUF1433 domain-containing protein [Bacillus]MDH4421426.1 DUF1433 domain-containing protein [Bacillus cereus]PER28303.1 hypothetical protein CN476_06640 [Bacillus cereus]PFA59544.1 hypothetical protein CN402_17030 [Bacillus sp. AFS015896]PGL86984.1 hypothetical protein CN931_04515 [Bacillus sp. AFS054943]PGT99933.1 hypothetical protein COD19_17745 [Bacillus cereus]
MKNKLVIFTFIICIIAGGYFTMEYLKQKEQEEKFWKVQEARVEKYIHYNIKDVKTITFKEHSVSPMGVPRLKGYINNDEKLDFIAYISTTENFEDDFTCSGELDEMIKKPAKSVTEIAKEEKREE